MTRFGRLADAEGFAAFLAKTTDLDAEQAAVLVRLATEGMRGDDFIEHDDLANRLFVRWLHETSQHGNMPEGAGAGAENGPAT